MIDFDYSRRPAKPSEWIALLEAIRDAEPGDETDWLEWKSTVDWNNREQIGETVARAILGMANRPKPPAALEFSGLIVIGLEAGSIHGVTPIDSADLEAKLRPYLGEDGPAFDPQRRKVDGLDVLTIEVPNPPPGSPIYTLQKQIKKYQAGAIFVRNPGRTDQASPAQVAALVARASQSAVETIDIELAPDTAAPLPRVHIVEESEVDAYVEWERDRLTRGLDDPAPSGFSNLISPITMENRSAQKFRREVEDYLANVRQLIRDRLTEFGGAIIPPIILRVSNRGMGTYPALHVTLFIEGPVLAVDSDPDPDEGLTSRLPRPPRAFGTHPMTDIASVDVLSRLRPASPPTRRKIESGDRLVIRLAEVELRSDEKGVVIEDELVLLVAPEYNGPLVVSWEATAANIKGIARGSFELPLAQETVSLFRSAIQVDVNNQKKRRQ